MPDSQLRLMLELGAAACAVCVPVGIAWWYSTRTPSCKPPPAWQDPISLDVWSAARCVWESAPELRGCLQPIFQSHSLDEAVVTILAELLAQAPAMPTWRLKKALMSQAGKGALPQLMRSDLNAVIERDPAATSPLIPLLHFKGFQALQTHRIAHELWCSGQRPLALWLQGRVSQTFQLDIHPAAQLGGGLLFDHATGVVIGETVVMGRCCSMLHGVTLGATGKDRGDRHPKIGNGVSIGAGASILGNIRIGDYAKIGCGSVVLQPVPEGATAVGIPCRIIPSRRGSGIPSTPTRAYVDHSLDDCDPFYRSAWKTMTEMGLQMRHGDLVTFEKFRAAVTRCGASEYDASNMFFQMDVHHHGVLTLDELRNSFSATSLQNPDSHFNASVDDLVRNLDLVHNFSRTA